MSEIYTPTVDWMIIFEDTEHGLMAFTDEDSARKAYEMKAQNWNCHLFYRVSSESGIDYPKAEIQKLQQRITDLEQQLKTAKADGVRECGKHIMQGLLSKQVNEFEFEEYANNLEGK